MTNELAIATHLESCAVLNTHSHHLKDTQLKGMTLFSIIRHSYISWIMTGFEADSPQARKKFLTQYRCNSYAYWLVRAIEALYPVGKPLDLSTWDEYDLAIQKAYEDPLWHLEILSSKCNYRTVILDKYDDPGSDNGHPELFRPTLRCDAYFSGYDPNRRNHDGVGPYDRIPYQSGMTLADYYLSIKNEIRRAKKEQKICSLKIGMAYERALDFTSQSEERAAKAYLNPQAADEDIRIFQDFIMGKLVQYAEELDLPIQIHTGLGQLKGTGAMALYELINDHSGVKFDLFHGSFPWTDDVLALAHNFNHVYIDLCWLPIISTTRAVTFIKEALEVTDAERLLWGCDTWTSEESYGALLAGKTCLSRALAELVGEGRFDLDYAKILGEKILNHNAAHLFKID